jgi:MoaA/NifB/PqqE/SkfB family radical SAM enzyme
MWEDYVVRDLYRRPRKAQEDKFYLSRAMLRSLDRALAEGRISRRVWMQFLKSFGRVHLDGADRREAFLKEFDTDPPAFLAISPTGLCNLHCHACYADSSERARAMLPFAIVDRAIREQQSLWGSYFTVISGGEPFLWRSEGKGLLELAEQHRNHFFLCYTNGIAINDPVAQRLAELGNITPAISVEGFAEETDARRGEGVYDIILKTFARLREVGVPFGVSVTATCQNADLLMSREFIDFYLRQQGAIYCWIFQYMPIGREFNLGLMLTPEKRFQMLKRTWRYIYEDGYFIADFWNCGTFSDGCISAGRHGGYFHIDWNGNVAPCVFNPYYVQNIQEVYASGGDLNTILNSAFFQRIRRWADAYAYDPPAEEMDNIFAPCAIRDHYAMMYNLIREVGATPADEPAKEALASAEYYRGLVEYDRRLDELTRQTWEREYLEPETKRKEAERLAAGKA